MKTLLADTLLSAITVDSTVVGQLTISELRQLAEVAAGEAKVRVDKALAARTPTTVTYKDDAAQLEAFKQGLSLKMALACKEIEVKL